MMNISEQHLPDPIRHYTEIDIAKGIGIICIVAGHVFPMTMFNQFLFSFHVPLFFLLSGFTYRYCDDKKTFFGNKFRRLIVPYLFFSLVSILLMWGMDKLIPLNADTRILPNIAGMLYGNSNSKYMTWNSPLWFLPCMFVSLAVMDLMESILRYIKKENNISLRIVLVLALWLSGILINTRFSVYLPFHIESALFLTGFSELGYILSRYKLLKQVKHSCKSTRGLLVLCACFGLIIGITASYFNGWTDIRTHLFGQFPVLLVVTSVAFSLITALVSVLIRKCQWLEYIGIHSMAILVMHKFPVMFFKMLVPGVQETLNNSGSISGFLAGLVITALSLVACLVCDRILMVIFPYALGTRGKKETITR